MRWTAQPWMKVAGSVGDRPERLFSSQQVGLEEASIYLKDLINAALAGEDVVIVKDERAMVRLVPMTPKPRRQAGSAKGMIHLADDFDAPLEDFEEYMS